MQMSKYKRKNRPLTITANLSSNGCRDYRTLIDVLTDELEKYVPRPDVNRLVDDYQKKAMCEVKIIASLNNRLLFKRFVSKIFIIT